MADSKPWLTIPTSGWVNVYVLAQLPTGTEMQLTNVGSARVKLAISQNVPATDAFGVILNTYGNVGFKVNVSGVTTNLWAKSVSSTSMLSVQV